ncbi:MAG: hypothetical protein JO032_05090 [Alphaproteobacteria bacterium]|nr:hypothetical protein [Alphaproteobacteria bacterium]MBV9552149.1 hypothetical protein [Alphaproteobacteria bacterium]
MPEVERACVLELQDRMIDLLVEQDEAESRGDKRLAGELQRRIDGLSVACREIRRERKDR